MHPNRIEIQKPGGKLRVHALAQDASDPTKWHLAEAVPLATDDAAAVVIGGRVVETRYGPAPPVNTIFWTPRRS